MKQLLKAMVTGKMNDYEEVLRHLDALKEQFTTCQARYHAMEQEWEEIQQNWHARFGPVDHAQLEAQAVVELASNV